MTGNEKFTPGPWEAIHTIVCPMGKRVKIADCYHPPQITDENGEAQANAALIAAAPDMYAALERISEYGDCFGYKTNETNPYEQVMAALRKARRK